MKVFGSCFGPEAIGPLIREELGRRCTPLRGAFVVQEENTPDTQIAIVATSPGDEHAGHPPRKNSAEIAIIRAGLPDLGVEEVLSADWDGGGYVLVVRPTERIGKHEDNAEGFWTFTPDGMIKLGRLLQRLGALAWRAWEEAAVPQLAAGEEVAEREDGASSEEGPLF
jgi:hypothetical protein